jgi:streptomycin 6-kinase
MVKSERVGAMIKLTENIVNIHREIGRQWIANLPTLVDLLSQHWRLTNLIPVDNMTYNYVAKAISRLSQPVVIKISCDKKSYVAEKQALLFFDGNASIKLIDYNDEHHALLLQQAVSGVTLKSFYPAQAEFVVDCYVDTMRKLHNTNIPKAHHFPHINEWLQAIDKLNKNQLPAGMLQKVINMKNELLASLGDPVVLHGDLHHDNILKNGNQWVTIDPKGIIGEPEFEIAAFDFEFMNQGDTTKVFNERVQQIILRNPGLDGQRIKEWVIVRLILSAAWFIEDHGDPNFVIKLAEKLI